MQSFKSSPNDLPPIVFQKLSTENKLVVKQFFNVCLLCPYFPAKWKRAMLKILRKPNKTLLCQHKTYRPISILPVLGKWFGKIILQRLLWHQNTNNWISQKQFGFQPEKSCIDAAVNLVEKIEAAFKQNKYVLVIYLDIAGAFDGAWHPAIIKGFIDRQCPHTLINSFLSDRVVSLKLGTKTVSKHFTMSSP